MSPWVVGAWMLLTAWTAAACFYDSRWGQEEAEQRRAAKRRAPATLGAGEKSSAGLQRQAPLALRALRVRAYATQQYVAETVDWQRQLEDTLETANAALHELHVRLELERATLWRPEKGSGTLETMIAALRRFDAGQDVDFVLALVGSLPRIEFSFHQLGMAGLLGKHMVIRAMNDAAELEAIQKYLDELDEAERHKLYQSRKRHKNASVLLHELGHALGALHVNNPKDLMHPQYSHEAQGFGAETRALLVIALRRPRYASDLRDKKVVIEESLVELQNRASPAWVRGERDARIADLQKMLAGTAPQDGAAARSEGRRSVTPPPPAAPEPPAALTPEDRKLFEQAARAVAANGHRAAWATAEPLFAKYPRDYAIQELRCKIASGLSLEWDEIRDHCQPMMELTPGIPGTFRGSPR